MIATGEIQNSVIHAAEGAVAQVENVAVDQAAVGNVTVSVDSLVIGCRLENPIYDMGGLLLLAAGSTVTPQLKSRLRLRHIDQIRISTEDAAAVTLNADNLGDCAGGLGFDTELTRKLDEMIDSGQMFLADSGNPVRDRVVLHGCKAFNPAAREGLISRHRETACELDKMMHTASHGGSLRSNEIATIAATYLTELTVDSDCVLSAASEASRDHSISQHCLQLSMLGMALGIEMGLDAENVRTLGICGLVHDWGMTKVPAKLREANRILSNIEYLGVKKHSIYSLELLQKIEGIPKYVPVIAYQLHERPNGTGYPRGRSGESIHKCARILNVADAYIHLTSQQRYRPPVMPYYAMECLLKMAKLKSVDSDVVRSLLHIQSLFPIGSLVNLNDGSIAQVMRRNGNDFIHPIVQVIQDGRGTKVDTSSQESIVDLAASTLRIVQPIPNPKRREIVLKEEELQFQLRR